MVNLTQPKLNNSEKYNTTQRTNSEFRTNLKAFIQNVERAFQVT